MPPSSTVSPPQTLDSGCNSPLVCCSEVWPGSRWRHHHLLAQGFSRLLARLNPAQPLPVCCHLNLLPQGCGEGLHQLPALIISQQVLVDLRVVGFFPESVLWVGLFIGR